MFSFRCEVSPQILSADECDPPSFSSTIRTRRGIFNFTVSQSKSSTKTEYDDLMFSLEQISVGDFLSKRFPEIKIVLDAARLIRGTLGLSKSFIV